DAKGQSIESINHVQPTVVKKDEAKQAIDAAATVKKAEIDQTPNATDEEKSEAKAKVDEAVTEAKHQIEQATNNQGVDDAKSQGIESINHVQPTVVKKDEAKQAIDAVATIKKAEIDKNVTLTDEEKQFFKKKVERLVEEIKHQIDQNTTNQMVDTSKNNGIESINHLNIVGNVKVNAIKHLLEIAQKQKELIDQNKNATIEEKREAQQKVDELLKMAKDSINASTTNSDVSILEKNYIDQIRKLTPSTETKINARKAIEDVARKQKALIDAMSYLTNNEKRLAKQKIDNIMKRALEAINNSDSAVDIGQIVIKTIEEIRNIKPISTFSFNNSIFSNKSTVLIRDITSNNTLSKLPNTGKVENERLPIQTLIFVSGLVLLLRTKRKFKKSE
ncbi:DUF1542 domain-containing protein, partial [Staphylococcus hominis]